MARSLEKNDWTNLGTNQELKSRKINQEGKVFLPYPLLLAQSPFAPYFQFREILSFWQ